MPTLNQTKALEEAAQRLAKHAGRDYSKIRMVDHYLRRKGRKDPAIGALVAEADAIVRPLFDRITDLEAEGDLLRHRLRICHTETRALVEHLQGLPRRLPSHLDQEHAGFEVRAWLQAEVDRAPVPPYAGPAGAVQP